MKTSDKKVLLFAACCAFVPVLASRARAQQPVPVDSSAAAAQASVSSIGSGPLSLILVGSDEIDRLRSEQLKSGVAEGQSLLLRSPSSLTPPAATRVNGWSVLPLWPQLLYVSNSALPYSPNYGSLEAQKGSNLRALAGAKIERGQFRLILAPEFVYAANESWILRHDFYAPALPPGRSPYDLPYYVGAFTIDQPMRLGNKPIRRLDAGQSTAMISARAFSFGASNENEWWGPGLRNAIVLSDNAPGFPHLFLRTARPLKTRIGDVELRWLTGGLRESSFFDTVSTNNYRSLSSVAVSLQTRWDPNLSIGAARSVYGPTRGLSQAAWRWFDALGSTPRTKDQLFSLFSRWVFPRDGVEIYAEWARLRMTPSLRDLLVAPNHTQGYTLGMQWIGGALANGNVRFQGEITQLEQSATFRDGPGPSYYTSTRVIQGYTNRGAMLGASIGPGAQSQFIGLDYLRKDWRFGGFGGRIRWNEDVHSNFGFPPYASYCNHDVSVYGGVRGARSGRFGSLTADLTLQDRLNAFFQNAGGCPFDRRLDIHNTTLSISFSPRR